MWFCIVIKGYGGCELRLPAGPADGARNSQWREGVGALLAL